MFTLFVFFLVLCAISLAVLLYMRRASTVASGKVKQDVEKWEKDGKPMGRYGKLDTAAAATRHYNKERGVSFFNMCSKFSLIGFLVFLVACSLFFAGSGVRTVPAGQVYVLDLFGKVDKEPIYPGINIINPLKDLTPFSTRTEVYVAGGVANIAENATVYSDEQIVVLSKDGLPVGLDMTVWFRVIPGEASDIYAKLGTGYIDKVVRPNARSSARNALVSYNATDLYQAGREKLVVDIEKELKIKFRMRGLICEKVELRNIQLPKMISTAISQKLEAQQEAQKMEFKLQKEEKEADRKRIEARGIKDSQDIIQATLTAEYLSYYYIETLRNLVNSPNNTVMILPMDQSLTPMLNIPSGKVVGPLAK